MKEIFYKCKAKVSDGEVDRPGGTLRWAFSQPGEVRLKPEAIECGSWVIPYREIDQAVLSVVRAKPLSSYTLLVKWRGKTYQFRLVSNSQRRLKPKLRWPAGSPVPLRKEVARAAKKKWSWSFLLKLYFVMLVLGLLLLLYLEMSAARIPTNVETP